MAHQNAQQLILRAEAELNQVTADSGPDVVFLHAHMAALRAAAAVVQAERSLAGPRSRRAVRSVWEQLGDVSASWEPWARYFSQQATVRAAIESGRESSLTARAAETALGAATDFLARAQAAVAELDAPVRMAS